MVFRLRHTPKCDRLSSESHTVGPMSRTRPFEDPVSLPGGGELVTLDDAAAYIMKLSRADRDSPEWQAAGEALILAAEGRGPLMHARVGMLRAPNQNVECVLDSSRKDAHWGKRKLKRDQ
jgi:hypothetical protein